MDLITEDWLKQIGFRWHELERQNCKQWLLWLADTFRTRGDMVDTEDLGIELSRMDTRDAWHCWLRADTAHKYSRFLHIRHLRTQQELIQMIEGITGQQWNPENNVYGSMMRPEHAASIKADWNRLDKRIMREGHPWREIEKDDSRGGALPEHMEDSILKGTSK